VTVTEVKIHQSNNASASDSMVGFGFRPRGQSDTGGFALGREPVLSGGSAEIEACHYQQIRVILSDNSVRVNGDNCGSVANCVMLTGDPSNTPQALQLSSESKT
jgi:hypothetical protein